MKRGEVWTVAGGAPYLSKPRPVAILQSDAFAETDSVTVCPLTTDATDAPLLRIRVEPGGTSGLREPSWLMADKITTVARARLGAKIGMLEPTDMAGLSFAALVFLNLIGRNSD
jgi:mRNA interferase MazF